MRALRRPRHALATLALAAFGVLGCSDSPTGPSGPIPAQIVLPEQSLTLRQMDSAQVSPSVLDKSGSLITGVVVKFKSADTTIAKVSAIGVIKSVGRAGSTTITLTSDKVHFDLPVTVTAVSGSLVVTPNPITVPQKGTTQVTAKVLDLAGNPIAGKPVAYLSNDPSLATVDPATGLVTSTGPSGTAMLIVTCDTITVLVPIAIPQVPTSIRASSDLTLAQNSATHVSARVLDAVGATIAGAPLTYTSDNSAIVAVANDGTVRSFGTLGSANITVHSGTLTATVKVTVVVASHPAGTLDGTVALSNSPWGVAISRSGVVYVGGLYGDVLRADLPSYNFTTAVSGTTSAASVVFNSSGTTAYVMGGPGNQLNAIDVARNTVLWSVPLTGTPFAVALSPDELTVYGSTGDGIVVAVDVASHSAKATVNVGWGANFMAMAPDGQHLYVNDFTGGTVYEIDTHTTTVSRTFAVNFTPQGLVVAPNNAELYVANEAGYLQVVDLATGSITDQVSLGAGAFGLAMTPDGQQLYAALTGAGQVAVIDRTSHAVLKTIGVNGAPRKIAFDPVGTTAAVTLDYSGVSFIK